LRNAKDQGKNAAISDLFRRLAGGERESMMTQWPARLVLVGAGKMGGAMAQGWLGAGLTPSSLIIVEPDPSREIASLAAKQGIALNPQGAAPPPDMLVLAVKPQSLDKVAPQIAALVAERTLVLSILAGKTIANLTARLPRARAVVRAMPNLPAAIGKGVTAAAANRNVTGEQRAWCEHLLGAVGAFHWLDDESAIDAVTAISGSGPAYIFALTEALAAAGERLGLKPELSMRLARGTVEGAAELMRRDSSTTPETLRRNVTSPGGTTAAALAVLLGPEGLNDLMARATAAARARAAEMAG
jgi:pyrroline-5-carboxylate reductase